MEDHQTAQETPRALSKSAILQSSDIPFEAVDMRPYGWPGVVYISGLSAAGRDAWESSLVIIEGKKSKPDMANVRAKLLQRCLCDEHRQPLFTEQDLEALGKKSGRAMDHLYKIAVRLSGIGEEDIKELVKN